MSARALASAANTNGRIFSALVICITANTFAFPAISSISCRETRPRYRPVLVWLVRLARSAAIQCTKGARLQKAVHNFFRLFLCPASCRAPAVYARREDFRRAAIWKRVGTIGAGRHGPNQETATRVAVFVLVTD